MSHPNPSVNHLAELSNREEPFEVLGEDKGTLLLIPPALISPTEGAVQYLIRDRQAKKQSSAPSRRFQLCCMYRSGSCSFGMYCGYIHSRHVLDPSLASQVISSPVHEKIVLNTVDDAPYKRHDAGLRIAVFDPATQGGVEVPSELIYETEGSTAALEAQQRHLASPDAPVPAAARLCHFFEQNFCGRGRSCKYIHRVPLVGTQPPPKPPPPPWTPPALHPAPAAVSLYAPPPGLLAPIAFPQVPAQYILLSPQMVHPSPSGGPLQIFAVPQHPQVPTLYASTAPSRTPSGPPLFRLGPVLT